MAVSTPNFTIGKLSKVAGVHIETIRYYERIGLLSSPPRSAGGYRLYSNHHLDRLIFLRHSRELGFSIEEIQALLGLLEEGDYTCKDIRTLTVQHLHDVRQKIGGLRKLERALVEISSHCDGGPSQECPILETLFDAHGNGSIVE